MYCARSCKKSLTFIWEPIGERQYQMEGNGGCLLWFLMKFQSLKRISESVDALAFFFNPKCLILWLGKLRHREIKMTCSRPQRVQGRDWTWAAGTGRGLPLGPRVMKRLLDPPTDHLISRWGLCINGVCVSHVSLRKSFKNPFGIQL